MTFTVENVPEQRIEKYVSNFYNVNGMYIDNYSYAKITMIHVQYLLMYTIQNIFSVQWKFIAKTVI